MSVAPRWIWTAVGAGIAIFGSVAHAIEHEYQLEPGRAYDPSLKRALLIPINQTIEVPAGLDVAEQSVTELIVNHLESKGLVVETLEIDRYQELSSQATRKAKKELLSIESGSTADNVTYSDIVSHLLAALESEADLVVVPNMVIRSADYVKNNPRWDGVRRRQKGSRGTLTGTTTVASLFVAIYDPKGTQVFSGYGGLDMLFEINRKKKRYDLMEDRLQDVKNLREGVCIAFEPFFGAAKRCR